MADGGLTLGYGHMEFQAERGVTSLQATSLAGLNRMGVGSSKQFSEPAVSVSVFVPRSEYGTSPDPGHAHHKSPELIEGHALRIRPFHMDSYSALSSALIALTTPKLTTNTCGNSDSLSLPLGIILADALDALSGCCGSY